MSPCCLKLFTTSGTAAHNGAALALKAFRNRLALLAETLQKALAGLGRGDGHLECPLEEAMVSVRGLVWPLPTETQFCLLGFPPCDCQSPCPHHSFYQITLIEHQLRARLCGRAAGKTEGRSLHGHELRLAVMIIEHLLCVKHYSNCFAGVHTVLPNNPRGGLYDRYVTNKAIKAWRGLLTCYRND